MSNENNAALIAMQRLETALELQDDSPEQSQVRLAAARAEAERILSSARAAGQEAALRRRMAILAHAEADAEAIEAAGQAAAEQLVARVNAERALLVTGFRRLVLGKEVHGNVGTDDPIEDRWSPNGHRADPATASTARAG